MSKDYLYFIFIVYIYNDEEYLGALHRRVNRHMKDNISILLDYLWHHYEHWVAAGELSSLLHVSTRQIRKYVSSLNENETSPLVISSNKGYRLNSAQQYLAYREKGSQNVETPQTRQNLIIQKLISSQDGIDLFDLADELFVSESTIENDIRSIRKIVSSCNVTIHRDHDLLYLEGSEKDKRRLMSRLISSDTYDNFVLKDEVRLLTYHYHFWDFRKNLADIFSRNNVFANDYTLNNTALHLIVMIDRIRNACELNDQVDFTPFLDSQQYLVAQEIKQYIEKNYQIHMNDAEVYNLTLIISNNTTMIDYSFINGSNISSFIEQKYIDIAHAVIHNVEERYLLDAFDEEFIAKFTIHVKNLFNRVAHNYYAKNPLTAKIKATYPLIYDIAVYIAQQFKENYDVVLNEDEITFISFHIGSYFENNVQSKNKLTILFLYADYYSIHQHTLEKISRHFEDKITIKYAVSMPSYQPNMLHADLIISTVEARFPQPYVLIHPFLTNKDMALLETTISKMLSEKNKQKLKDFLFDLFDPRLFYTDVHLDRTQLIQKLCNDAIALDYAEASFTQDVFAREHMSSTAFEDAAVPHSLGDNAKKSFISVVLCPDGMQWGVHEVHIVTLLGVHDDSRQIFAQIFDQLIEILSEPAFLKDLINCQDYQTFIRKLTAYINEVSE